MLDGVYARVPVFVAVAEHRSFSAAARSLGISPSAASQAVASIERGLGVSLFARTSRSVRLTSEGERLLAVVQPSLEAMLDAMTELRTNRDEPCGTLRLNVVRIACRIGLPPVLAELTRRHPRLRVQITVDNRPIDIVGGGFDAGVRVKEAVRSEMVRTRLTGPIRMVVVGSKAYLRHHGRPMHPRDLARHTCIGWSFTGSGARRWPFRDERGGFEIGVQGPIVADDADLLATCAEQDLGLVYVAEPEVRRQLESGRLVSVLDDYTPAVEGLFLYHPSTASRVANVRALLQCARAVARNA